MLCLIRGPDEGTPPTAASFITCLKEETLWHLRISH